MSRTKVINYCAKYATKSEPRSPPIKDVYKHIDSDTSLKAVQKLLINYCAKYATKSEPRSPPIKDVYKHIDSDTSLKAVQKLLINSVGEIDYSTQETSLLLLQIPLFMASRDFVVLSFDGSRALVDRLDNDRAATNLSSLDHYKARPDTPLFNSMTLLTFMQEYTSLKAVQKLLINSVGERDYSAQETSLLLLQILLFMASRDFVVLSFDGSRALADRLDNDRAATNLFSLDHYKARPDTPLFNSMTLLTFMQEYKVTKGDESRPERRTKEVVVIVRLFLSPDPDGPSYEQYCKQKLILHKPFHVENNLLENHLTFTEAYASFLSTGNVPPSLADDVDRLEHQVSEQSEDNTTESDTTTTELDRNRRYVQE